jgi:hypothetical protein
LRSPDPLVVSRRGYNRRVGEDRRPSLWKSLKRAFAGGAPARPATIAPQAPSAQILPDVNAAPPFLGEFEPAAESFPAPPPIPKPDPLPDESRIPVKTPISAAKEGEASGPEATRLARGLASFSRRNSEREKKFAHLLHDAPSKEKKETTPPERRD